MCVYCKVELIGRVQRQTTVDNRYYTCIDYLKVVGTPLYGFEPSGADLALTPAMDPPPDPTRAGTVLSRASAWQSHVGFACACSV